MDATTTPQATRIIVPAGAQTRISAATASRDFTADIVPGEYAIEYTDSCYNPVREGERPYYVLARVEIDTPDRTESTVEFGGVALASARIEGKRQPHILTWYAYQVELGGQVGRISFA